MRILVTGREGQVARALRERGTRAGVEVIAIGRPELDLAQPASIALAVVAARPDAVVNAAAYTNVDGAEDEAELAFSVNAAGAGAVAAAAREIGVPVIQLSTDYVFDGKLSRPYREDDPVNPINAYGRSKHAGESAVAQENPDHAILRTAWVYSPFGKNFLKTMLGLAAGRDSVSVVADRHGAPTSAHDIADAVLAVARNLCGDSDPKLRGVFHMTATGEATWADFAVRSFEESAARQGQSARVEPIASADYPARATRPANSRLDSRRLGAVHGVALPRWEESLPQVVQRCLAAGDIR